MGKPKMLGYFKPYTPNNRADFRHRKRGRNPADRVKPATDTNVGHKKKEATA